MLDIHKGEYSPALDMAQGMFRDRLVFQCNPSHSKDTSLSHGRIPDQSTDTPGTCGERNGALAGNLGEWVDWKLYDGR